jgi:hypothetical protein
MGALQRAVQCHPLISAGVLGCVHTNTGVVQCEFTKHVPIGMYRSCSTHAGQMQGKCVDPECACIMQVCAAGLCSVYIQTDGHANMQSEGWIHGACTGSAQTEGVQTKGAGKQAD